MKRTDNKSSYRMVTIIYSDYSDYSETFEMCWGKIEAVDFMLSQNYNKYKTKICGLQIKEITVAEVTKYTYIED